MNLQRKAFLLIVLGVLAGIGWLFIDDQETASLEWQEACRAVISERYSKSSDALKDMLPRCNQANFAALMTAKTATEAARSVSSVNQNALWVHVFRSFLLGLALVLTVLGGILFVTNARRDKHKTPE